MISFVIFLFRFTSRWVKCLNNIMMEVKDSDFLFYSEGLTFCCCCFYHHYYYYCHYYLLLPSDTLTLSVSFLWIFIMYLGFSCRARCRLCTALWFSSFPQSSLLFLLNPKSPPQNLGRLFAFKPQQLFGGFLAKQADEIQPDEPK